MHYEPRDKIRDEVLTVLREKHGLDSFETREMLGMMFCQAVVHDVRKNVIADPEAYLQAYVAVVRSNLPPAAITT